MSPRQPITKAICLPSQDTLFDGLGLSFQPRKDFSIFECMQWPHDQVKVVFLAFQGECPSESVCSHLEMLLGIRRAVAVSAF